MAFKPSAQQKTLFNWIRKGKGNAFVAAVAGAGKTTSLIEGARLMEGQKLLVAFNKKIADELAIRIQDKGIENADGKTFHAVGFAAWKAHINNIKKFPKVNRYKVQNMIEKYGEKNRMPLFDKDYGPPIRKLVSLAKQTGIGMPGREIAMDAPWYALIDRHDIGAELVKDIKIAEILEYARMFLTLSNEATGEVDFDDMIYLPVLHDVDVPFQYDWVMVDEAQDSNPVRRILAAKLVKEGGRMIWVGDRAQAIYGFTGADNDAVDQIIAEFKCTELPLTVTYRCPKTVVAAAQYYVSEIIAHETAPEGKVEKIQYEVFDEIDFVPGEDAVLCRKTAPLIKIAYMMIRRSIPCQIEGKSDIGAQLLAMLTKWKRIKTLPDFLAKLEDWEATEIAKYTDEMGKAKQGQEMRVENIRDRVETMRVLCEGCPDLDCVKNKIQSMFADTPEGQKAKKVILSTVHKAKGREWNNVYVYGFAENMPSRMAKQAWQMDQERNLIYVAFTRAQKVLTLVN
jgi:DNA helicase II / ATP-dependent DNA helicase PcrA